MKEPIGHWLGLKPVPPRKGTFSKGPNTGKKFMNQPAGFRFESYTFIVVPGTTIAEPVANCAENKTEERPICTFSIGFGRGPKDARINRWRIEEWILSTRRKDFIMGFITPSGVKHIWKGAMDSKQIGGGVGDKIGDIIDGFDFGGLLDSADDIISIGRTVGGLLF
jgi:hypothetical protein